MKQLVGKHQLESLQQVSSQPLPQTAASRPVAPTPAQQLSNPAQQHSMPPLPLTSLAGRRSAPTSLATTAVSLDNVYGGPQSARNAASARSRAWPSPNSDQVAFAATVDTAELDRLSSASSSAKLSNPGARASSQFQNREPLFSSALPFSSIEKASPIEKPVSTSIDSKPATTRAVSGYSVAPQQQRPRAMSSANISTSKLSAPGFQARTSVAPPASVKSGASSTSLSSAQTCFNAGEAMLRVRARLAVSELVKQSEILRFGDSLLESILPAGADLSPVLLLFERAVALDSGS